MCESEISSEYKIKKNTTKEGTGDKDMKEKVIGLVKQPLFIITLLAIVCAVGFGAYAGSLTPKTPKVVKEFCEAFAHFHEGQMADLIAITPNTKVYTSTTGFISSMKKIYNQETQTITYQMGEVYEEKTGVTVSVVHINIYEEKRLVGVYEILFYVETVGGKQVISGWEGKQIGALK